MVEYDDVGGAPKNVEDGATKGAPTGTIVGDRLADVIGEQIDRAQLDASTAKNAVKDANGQIIKSVDLIAQANADRTAAATALNTAKAQLASDIANAQGAANDAVQDVQDARSALHGEIAQARSDLSTATATAQQSANTARSEAAQAQTDANTARAELATEVARAKGEEGSIRTTLASVKQTTDTNTAALSDEAIIRARDDSALAVRSTALEARSRGAGNLLPNTSLSVLNGWTVNTQPSGHTVGINQSGIEWLISGENAITISQNGNNQPYCEVLSDPVAFGPGDYVEGYAFTSSHRAYAWVSVFFYNSLGQFVGYAGEYTNTRIGGGGNDIKGWDQVGTKAYRAPATTVYARLALRKFPTLDGETESIAWFSRPYLGLAHSAQSEWTPFSRGGESKVIAAVDARVTDEIAVRTDQNSAISLRQSKTEAQLDFLQPSELGRRLSLVDARVTDEAQASVNRDAALVTVTNNLSASYNRVSQTVSNDFFDADNLLWDNLPAGQVVASSGGRNNVLRTIVGQQITPLGRKVYVTSDSQRFKLRAGWRVVSGGDAVLYLGVIYCDAAGNALPAVDGYGDYALAPGATFSSGTGWIDRETVIGRGLTGPSEFGGTRNIPAGTVFIRPIMFLNYLRNPDAIVEVDYFTIEDVTEVVKTDAAIKNEATLRSDADSALGTRLSSTEAKLNGGEDSWLAARIRDEATASVDRDAAVALRTSTLETQVGRIPDTWTIKSYGNGVAPSLRNAGLFKPDGNAVNGFDRSYGVIAFAPGSNSPTLTVTFDVYNEGETTSGRGSLQMAQTLNSIPDGYTVIIHTSDEPKRNRLSNGLGEAMARVGAGEAFFSQNFYSHSAYVLIGRAGIGRGNGVEYYAGGYATDPNAYLEIPFTLRDGKAIVGGGGAANALSAKISDEASTRADHDSALGNRISTTEAKLSGDQDSWLAARVRDEATASVNRDASIAGRSSALESQFKGETDSELLRQLNENSNLLRLSDWVVGSSGSQGRFVQNGDTSENDIVMADGPFGYREPVWRMISRDGPSGGAADPDGGWSYFVPAPTIDPTASYRLMVWAKQETGASGTLYLGSSGGMSNMSGGTDYNPYFWYGQLPTKDKWYLIVGIAHGAAAANGESGLTGVYDPSTGERVQYGNDFRMAPSVTGSGLIHRAYQYYANAGSTAFFCRPSVEKIGSNTQSIQQLFATVGMLPSERQQLVTTTAKVDEEIITRTNQNSSLAGRTSALETSAGAMNTRISDEATASSNRDSALGNRISTTEAKLSGDQDSWLAARIRDEASASSNRDTAIANRTSTLETTSTTLVKALPIDFDMDIDKPVADYWSHFSDGSGIIDPRLIKSKAWEGGSYLHWIADVAGNAFSRNTIAIDPTRKYRISTRVGAYRNGTSGLKSLFYVGFVGLDAEGNILNHGSHGSYRYSAIVDEDVVDGQQITRSNIVTGEGNESWLTFPPGTRKIRLLALFNYRNQQIQSYVDYIKWEDVTEVESANARINEQATIASNATSAVGQRVSNIEAQVSLTNDSALFARIRAEEGVRSTADEALATRANMLETSSAARKREAAQTLPGFDRKSEFWSWNTQAGANINATWEDYHVKGVGIAFAPGAQYIYMGVNDSWIKSTVGKRYRAGFWVWQWSAPNGYGGNTRVYWEGVSKDYTGGAYLAVTANAPDTQRGFYEAIPNGEWHYYAFDFQVDQAVVQNPSCYWIRPRINIDNIPAGAGYVIAGWFFREVTDDYATNARIHDEASVRAGADSALANRASSLEATVNDGPTRNAYLNARINDEASVRADVDSALGTRVSTTEAKLSGGQDSWLAARIRDEATASADRDSAISGRTSSLETRAGNVEARVQTTEGAIATLNDRSAAYWQVEAAAGGRARLRAYADNYGSNIDIAADTIYLGDKRTLTVENGKVTVAGDIHAGAGKIIFDNGSVMKVSGTGFGSSNQFIEWFGPRKSSLSDCSEANASYYLKVDGSSYFGGSLSAGVLKNAVQTTSLHYQASVTTGAFGSNGGPRSVTVSYTLNGYTQIFDGCPASPQPYATVQLYRGENAGGVYLTEQRINGSVNCTPGSGQFEPGGITESIGGSFTFTDNSGGGSSSYFVRIVDRVTSTGINDQTLGVISIEQ